jgi:hypothetical protein
MACASFANTPRSMSMKPVGASSTWAKPSSSTRGAARFTGNTAWRASKSSRVLPAGSGCARPSRGQPSLLCGYTPATTSRPASSSRSAASGSKPMSASIQNRCVQRSSAMNSATSRLRARGIRLSPSRKRVCIAKPCRHARLTSPSRLRT